MKPLNIDKDSELVTILKDAYKEVITIPTGVSYSDLAPVIYTTAIRYVLNTLVGLSLIHI